MLTATRPRYLTIVELLTREQYWDDAQGCPARDYLNIERRSDYPLTNAAINQIALEHPGYMVGGITEIDLDNATDEF
jgi:hypothetical protein